MKKVVLILLMVPALLFAQKPLKPNLNKGYTYWRDGKLKEAKEMMDVCVTDPKISLDGKAWYYRGLVYLSLDTTSNEAFQALATKPIDTALESFKKADELNKKGSEYFINYDPSNALAVINKQQQLEGICNFYLNRGISYIQMDEPDYNASVDDLQKTEYIFENGMEKYLNDTLTYYVLAISAQASEQYDVAIEASNKYLSKGGRSKDAYTILYQIYTGPKKDEDKALEVVRKGKQRFPEDDSYQLMELELLINMGKLDEAKSGLEDAVKKYPENKTLHFFLGYANMKADQLEAAKANYNDALKIDPQYFEAQFFLAKVVSEDAKKIKKEMNALGISAADKKRKFELDAVYLQKLKVALPYWEKAEKLNPSDPEVLDELYAIYSDLDNQPQIKRIEKRFKELGIE